MIDRYRVYDSHAHVDGLLASLPGGPGPRTPADTPFTHFAAAGLDGCVVCAVGDPATFGVAPNTVESVFAQLTGIRSSAAHAGVDVVTGAAGLAAAGEQGRAAIMLGVEGADFLGHDLAPLAELHDRGVRLLGLMHYAQNASGSISMDLRGGTPGVAGERGLSDFGREVVRAANALGIAIDVTHAHDETVFGVLDCTTEPVICSHAGVRSFQEFPRYVSDDAARAIVAGGGILGMWPCRVGPYGPPTVADFARMIAHAAERFGAASVALGTDFNGAPAFAEGYRGPVDNAAVLSELRTLVFSSPEIEGILGGNLLRYLAVQSP